MDNVPGLGTPAETSRHIERLQPSDQEDAVRRALFYCHALQSYCKKQVDALIEHGLAGDFGGEVAAVCEAGIPGWSLERALKELTCISLHLAGLDQASENPPAWLMDFLFESLGEADLLFPEPSAAEVIQQHGSWKEERMTHDAAVSICLSLGFGEKSEQAALPISDFLTGARPYRSELLVFALSQPPEVLRHHLMLFG